MNRTRRIITAVLTTTALLISVIGAAPARAAVNSVVPEIWDPDYYDHLPTTGAAYTAVTTRAASSDQPDMTCLIGPGESCGKGTATLARAMLGDVAGVIEDIELAESTFSSTSDSLSVSRMAAPLPLAARIVGLDDSDFAFDLNDFFTALVSDPVDGARWGLNDLRDIAKIDPTNQGAMARAAVMWVAWFNNDATMKAEANESLVRYLTNGGTHDTCTEGSCGTPAANALAASPPHFLFENDDINWGGTYTIAPVGFTEPEPGFTLDGAIYDLYRSAGDYPDAIDGNGVNYVWEATQGTVFAAVGADAAGYLVWDDGNEAIKRSVDWMLDNSDIGAPTGDDTQTLWALDAYYDNYSETLDTDGTEPGKVFGFTDWVYGPRTYQVATTDTYINQASPSTNYGTNTQVHANNASGAVKRGYLLPPYVPGFLESGQSRTIESTKLRIYVQDATTDTVTISWCSTHASDPTETGLTWNNKPSCSAWNTLHTFSPTTTGWRWETISVGSPNMWAYTEEPMVFTTNGTDNFSFRSEENSSGAYQPELYFTYINN